MEEGGLEARRGSPGDMAGGGDAGRSPNRPGVGRVEADFVPRLPLEQAALSSARAPASRESLSDTIL